MSQIYKPLTSGGPIPPNIPTTFNTTNGTPPVADGSAVPAANIIIFAETSLSTNTADGFQVAASGNTVTYSLTNRIQGSNSTVGAASSTIASFSPTIIGTYVFEVRMAAYNTTSLLGAGASLFGAIRYDGANIVVCDLFDEINNDEGAMSATDLSVTAVAGTMNVVATGYAGQTINWSAVGLYTFVGA